MLAEERRTWNLFRVMRMDPSSRFSLSRRFSKATSSNLVCRVTLPPAPGIRLKAASICSFSCVSSSNSFSASASEWSLSRRSGAESSHESCSSAPLQAPCSSQPSWEFPSRGFTLPVDSGCWRSSSLSADVKWSFFRGLLLWNE